MPFHSARNAVAGDGSSTGSTICYQTARYQSAIRPTTPTSGRNGSTARFIRARTSRWNTSRQCALMRDEFLLRQRRVGARPRRVERHEVGDARRTARQQQHAVGEIHRLFEIVRDQHRRGAGLHEDALQLLAHEQRHLVVERRERLVEKQDFRLDHQRAHDRDELLLAAGHLVGIAVEVDLDAEMRDELLDPRAPLGLRHLHQLERIVDVVERAQPGKQRLAIVLEHVAELDLAQRLAVEQDFAGIDRDQPGDHVDQRALAAAVRPEHRDELAARNVEIEVVVDRRPRRTAWSGRGS